MDASQAVEAVKGAALWMAEQRGATIGELTDDEVLGSRGRFYAPDTLMVHIYLTGQSELKTSRPTYNALEKARKEGLLLKHSPYRGAPVHWWPPGFADELRAEACGA